MHTPATAWFHCFAGTAGDMTLGALVHAGASPDYIATALAALGVGGYAVSYERVQRCGLAATRAVVVTDEHVSDHEHEHEQDGHEHEHDHGRHRPYAEIRELVQRAELAPRVKQRALRTFHELAVVEAEMHGVTADEVEFHEVGSLDAIIDIVGVCAALESLSVERIVCSPITTGHGTVHAAHGLLPTPAPAVAGLLARRGAPARGIADHRELATPTGVALMTALADEFGPLPPVTVSTVGYGAGSADIPGRPNVVQVVVGRPIAESPAGQPLTLLEANVDDVTGEVIAHTIAALLGAGAVDAWATPIVMKKGRPAFTVHALCDTSATAAVAQVLVAETGTLGVRGTTVDRWPVQRDERVVTVDGQPIRVKAGAARIKVEFDDAARAAAALGVPVRDILRRAEHEGHR